MSTTIEWVAWITGRMAGEAGPQNSNRNDRYVWDRASCAALARARGARHGFQHTRDGDRDEDAQVGALVIDQYALE
jgi:hypothetical protein